MDPTAILKAISDGLSAASVPGVVALVLAIGLTQAVKAFDHLLPWVARRTPPNLKRGEVWTIAWLATAVLFPAVCLGLAAPVRGANFGLGLIAGVAAPIVSGALKLVGLDLDKW